MNGYIDLSGNAFANGFVPNVRSGFNEKKAVFFLFSPRTIGDHYKRPITYNFNNELVSSLADSISKSINLGDRVTVKNIFNNECARRCMIPSSKGIQMNYSKYDLYWTGVLIVFNDFPVTPNGRYDNQLNNHTIYLGIFDDEPLNPLTLYQESPTINFLSNFYITRKIIFNKIRAYNQNGLFEKDDLSCDIGVFRLDPSVLKDEDTLFNIEPENLLKNTEMTENNGLMITDLESINVNNVGYVGEKLETQLQSPKKHIDTVFESILQAADYTKYEREEQEFGGTTLDIRDSIKEASEFYLGNNSAVFSDNIGLSSNLKYQLSDIMRRYNPKVQPIIVPKKTSNADIIPQNIISPNNIYSSLIASCIPSYMARIGISSLAFAYNSFHGASKPYVVESFDSSNDQMRVKKWSQFLRMFRFEMEPVIRAGVGEFDLTINSSLNGSTYVHLNLMDFSQIPDNAVFEESSILGGMTSNNIGNKEIMFSNASQLGGLIDIISDNFVTIEDGISLFS